MLINLQKQHNVKWANQMKIHGRCFTFLKTYQKEIQTHSQ